MVLTHMSGASAGGLHDWGLFGPLICEEAGPGLLTWGSKRKKAGDVQEAPPATPCCPMVSQEPVCEAATQDVSSERWDSWGVI